MTVTSLERIEKAIARQSPDMVPVAPFVGFYAARIAGVSLFRYVTDGRTIADAQFLLWQRLEQDMVVTAADTYYIAEAFGLKIEFHENALPTAKEPILGNLKEAGRLRVPNPRTDGRMPVYLEAATRLARRLGDRVAVRGTGTGPFSLAAYLLGPQNLLLKLADMNCGAANVDEERGFVTLMDVASEAVIAFFRAQVEAGVHLLHLGDSLASRDMISPAMYRQYVMPYHRKVIDAVRADCRRRGARLLLHVCGNNTDLLKDFASTGAELYEVDSKISLETALRAIGGDVCLIGNLDPVRVLLQGSSDDVRRESRNCIAAASSNGGFILGTGCFVPWDTPLENLREMVRSAREFSRVTSL